MSSNKTKQVNVRLTKDQHEELATHAQNQGDVPISQVIRLAIVKYLNESKNISRRSRY
jgi:predicted HicB family RNase H-like nuclease